MTGTITDDSDVNPASDASKIKEWLRDSKKNLFGKSKISSSECGEKVLELLAKRVNANRVSIWKCLGDGDTSKVLKLFKSPELREELTNFVKAQAQRDAELIATFLTEEEWDSVAEVVCTRDKEHRQEIKQYCQDISNKIIKKMENTLDNKTHLASAVHFIEALFSTQEQSNINTETLKESDLASEKLIDTVLAVDKNELKQIIESDLEGNKLLARINKETSGFYRTLLRTYIQYVLDRAKYFGEVLLKDSSLPTLSRIVIARAEYDLADTSEYLSKKGSTSLAEMINNHQSIKPLLSQIAKTA